MYFYAFEILNIITFSYKNINIFNVLIDNFEVLNNYFKQILAFIKINNLQISILERDVTEQEKKIKHNCVGYLSPAISCH